MFASKDVAIPGSILPLHYSARLADQVYFVGIHKFKNGPSLHALRRLRNFMINTQIDIGDRHLLKSFFQRLKEETTKSNLLKKE